MTTPVTTKFVIASGKKPLDFEKFLATLHNAAANDGNPDKPIKLVGYSVVPGPGCYNHGLMIEGDYDEAVKFAETLCMVLQPAKYSRTDDNDPGVSRGQFLMEI